jgi:Transposase DDE domain
MKQGPAFMPAFNAEAVTTEQQIVVAFELTTEGVDFQQLEPMIASAERELRRAGVTDSPGVVLADAGYWSNGHIDSLRERGIVPIVAPRRATNRERRASADPMTSCAGRSERGHGRSFRRGWSRPQSVMECRPR